MTDAELGDYREWLGKKQAELADGLRRREGIAIERQADLIDEMQLTRDRELAVADLDRRTALLAEVRAALERIEDGSYGVCLKCEREISRARLAALPWAGYCVECQEDFDREREIPRGTRGMLTEAA